MGKRLFGVLEANYDVGLMPITSATRPSAICALLGHIGAFPGGRPHDGALPLTQEDK